MFYFNSLRNRGVFLYRMAPWIMLFKRDDPFWRCIAESKNQSADYRLFTDETPQFLYLFVSLNRSCLKIRIFVRDQDEAEDQTADILKYVEDLRRRLNAETCPPLAGRTKKLF
jgi:hypothetical protein